MRQCHARADRVHWVGNSLGAERPAWIFGREAADGIELRYVVIMKGDLG